MYNRKIAQKDYEKFWDLETKIRFKKSVVIARKLIKAKKRKNFRQIAASLNRFSNVRYVLQKINVFKNRDNKKNWGREGDEEYERAIL